MENSRSKRVTVRDIAMATGYHYTTVSMGLRDSPALRSETRRKIQEAAEQLGYRPDPMLSALNAYRRASRTPHFQAVIGWINNWPERDALLKMPSFREYFEGARERALQLGYLLEEFWLHEPGMRQDVLRRIFRARNIRAVLIAPQPFAHMKPDIDLKEVSAVAFGYSMQPARLNLVTNHQFHSMTLMLAELLKLGYRRIGFFLESDWDEKVDNAWIGSLLVAQRRHPEVRFMMNLENPNQSLKAWLAECEPDVVISHDGTRKELIALGYAIPKEIGFASLDIYTVSTQLSGIYQNNLEIGRKAVDVLVGMIHRGERGYPESPTRTLIESNWVPGNTLRKQRKKRK